VLIELDGVRLLTDPVVRNRIGPLVRVAQPIDAAGIGGVDGVLLSHLHADHTDLPSLRRIAPDTRVLAPHPASAWLRRKGLSAVRDVRVGETVGVGPVQLTAVPATHDRRRRPFGPDPIGYLVRGSRSVYFAGDTDLDPAMGELSGSVDIALVPIWGWGPSLGSGHLDPTRAAAAVALIAPEVAIPMHWGTFALPWAVPGQADLARPAAEFAALAKRRAPLVEVWVLAPGERRELSP
jgi:L-ascorbate metabolism protein UlaG (beta-lactamase superfamily)